MIVAIRISGMVDVPEKEEKILYNLRLRRKYSCILLKDKKILEKVRNLVAYGEIDPATLRLLIEKKGRKEGDKPIKESIDGIVKKLEEGKTLKEVGLKPFFRLHPPIGGFKKSTKVVYPTGVLGENKKINELIRRML